MSGKLAEMFSFAIFIVISNGRIKSLEHILWCLAFSEKNLVPKSALPWPNYFKKIKLEILFFFTTLRLCLSTLKFSFYFSTSSQSISLPGADFQKCVLKKDAYGKYLSYVACLWAQVFKLPRMSRNQNWGACKVLK